MERNRTNQVKQLKALADENRLIILEKLCQGELCACKLLEELSISQSTLSHHMKILCDSEMVVYRKEGKWMHYSLSKDTIEELRNYLSQFTKPM